MKSTKSQGRFTIFTMSPCPHCVNAKDLLRRENCDVEEKDSFTREELQSLVGPVRTLPQIVVTNDDGCFYIGGYTDLVAYFNGTGPAELRKLA